MTVCFCLDLATGRFAKKNKCANHITFLCLRCLIWEMKTFELCYLRLRLVLPFSDSKTKVQGKVFEGSYYLCSFHFPSGPRVPCSLRAVKRTGEQGSDLSQSHVTRPGDTWDPIYSSLSPSNLAIFPHSLISICFPPPSFSCLNTWVS